MAYGIEITNSDSLVQIADNRTSHILVLEGEFTITSTNYGVGSYTIPGAVEGDLVFIKQRPFETVRRAWSTNPNNGYVKVNGTGNFMYRVYRDATTAAPTSDTYGLEVYDSSSNLLFSSASRPPNFIGIVDVQDGSTSGSTFGLGLSGWGCLANTGLYAQISYNSYYMSVQTGYTITPGVAVNIASTYGPGSFSRSFTRSYIFIGD